MSDPRFPTLPPDARVLTVEEAVEVVQERKHVIPGDGALMPFAEEEAMLNSIRSGNVVGILLPDGQFAVGRPLWSVITQSGYQPSRPSPIRIPCEGSDHPAHNVALSAGWCRMCGVAVTCRDDGTTWPHERNDVLAMLERGDFE